MLNCSSELQETGGTRQQRCLSAHMLAKLSLSRRSLKRVEGWSLTEWMTAASAALTRMAVVPLSRMAVVACSATDRPLTLAPSNVTVQYLQPKVPHHIMPH